MAKLAVIGAMLAMSAAPAKAQTAGCPQAIVEVFGSRSVDACYVAWRESRWNAGATGSLGERGLFQIHPVHGRMSTYEPYANARAAYELSNGGRDWCSAWMWTCS